MVRTKGLALVLVLVLDEDVVLVLDEDVAIAQALTLALVLVLVLDKDVVRTQAHPARRHYSRGAGGGISNPLDRQRFEGIRQGLKDTGRGA